MKIFSNGSKITPPELIDSITETSLSEIAGANGNVLHGLKNTSIGYCGFGELYFSWILRNRVKGWKKHKRMTMNLVVPVGIVRFVFFSPSREVYREYIIGEKNYKRLTVPPGIWFAFQGVEHDRSLVINISDIVHDPEESDRMDLDKFSFDWNL